MLFSYFLSLLFFFFFFFFFNDTATTEIYTLSLHDALPISRNQLLEPVDVVGHFCSTVTHPRMTELAPELEDRRFRDGRARYVDALDGMNAAKRVGHFRPVVVAGGVAVDVAEHRVRTSLPRRTQGSSGCRKGRRDRETAALELDQQPQ